MYVSYKDVSTCCCEEKNQTKKNDVNARSLLLMALPNEHQLTFSQYSDAKTMFAAIETRFGVSMNKAEIETMSIDDLYNNFKIFEHSVKKSVGVSSGAQNLTFITAPSTSSTNDVDTAKPAYEVSIASPNVNTSSPQVSTASFSDNAVYAFMIENPNGYNLLQQDLEQIHEDDLEAMDLKWQLSLLSVRAKRYYQRTGKKFFINANDTAGYDKSKVECFNCHKMGHFARECRASRNKEGQFRYQDNTRKHGSNEDTSLKAMLAIDYVGFEWSDMAEEQVQTNMALMTFLDSEVYNDKTCSKTCLKNYETLKKQCDDLIVKLNQTEFTAATYKRGLATVEEQLITYRKNEVLFSEEVAVLKREVACKDYEINVLKSEFEKVKQEKEGIEFKIENFDKASKDLGSQITDKSKKGLGYNVVPPPHPLIYNRPKKLDLSYSGLDEFKDPEFKSYGSEESKQESNIVSDKKSDASKENSDDSLVKEQVSEDTSSFVESPLNVDKETVFLADKKKEFVKPKNHEKLVKKSVRYAEMYRSQSPRGNQRNWNGQKTHPNAQRNMVPTTVLMKTGLKPFNTARTVNAAHPKSIVLVLNQFNTAKAQAVNTARPKAVNTARPHSAVVNAVRVNQANDVKASTCWVWRPTKLDNASITLKKHNYIDAQGISKSGKPLIDDKGFVDSGCSRHMTGNIAYLSYFKEFDEGYVTFGGGAHGGRISGKGTLKTDSLNFEDEYFVNELKFNLFSVSQMCDKKNYVLFTNTECLVLSLNFKLHDESQILLKIPRKDNMYSFDMKNIVLKESLTCLVAKATSDESMLWHRTLGHINFKNINKLVKDNLVHNENLMQDVGNGEPKSAADDQKQDEDGPHNETDEKDKSEDDSSPKEVNATRQHVNTVSPEVNTGSFKLNNVDPSVNTASSYELDSPKDMFKLGATHTLETTHVEFFSDEDEPEVDLGNITNSYIVPTTPNTRIHKDHPIKNVIGDVWKLVDLPNGKRAIGTKWVFRNKKDERGIVIRNKARIEAIRLFLAHASFMGFLVYQMDVKSAYLYRTIEEEVYVSQPPGFKDPDHLDKVYKMVKALYGLHQSPRAWYETLANYLLGNGFKRGKIDQTLFIKKQKGDILLVQVYIDDIIFGSTNKELCTAFEKLMKDNQDKYVAEILKKFNYTDVKSASTPVDLEKPLVKDRDVEDVDVHLYRSMIGSLMYLTTSRPDIMFAFLDSPFELVAYTDSDYAGATQDKKSTTEGCQFLGNRLISWQCKKKTMVSTSTTKAEYVAAASYLLIKGFDAGRHVKRGRDTKIPQSSGPPVKVGDEAIQKELGDIMERVAIIASSLEAEQDSGNINRT
ncbi:putative ribonuclease H-like domain-containing protein [Tanacetum coccineum]